MRLDVRDFCLRVGRDAAIKNYQVNKLTGLEVHEHHPSSFGFRGFRVHRDSIPNKPVARFIQFTSVNWS